MFNEIDAYAIELYIGEMRSGKTLSMVYDTYNDMQKFKSRGMKVYANFHLDKKYFPTAEIITKEGLMHMFEEKEEFQNSIFLIDELQLWLDNREFMKKGNKAISYLFGQCGKRGNVLRGTVHDYMMIDLRGRLYAGRLNYVLKGLLNPAGKWQQMKNYNARCTDEENARMYIQRTRVIKKLVKTNFLPEFVYIKSKPDYVPALRVFSMYDTRELIEKQDNVKKKED